jgi:ADP-heptose:LPS heptosyltransferase
VIRLGALGDVVRTLPAVSALRATYPRAHLAWLVEPASAGMLAGQPWIDETLVFPRDALVAALSRGRLAAAGSVLAAFLRELRLRRFDLVLDFHSILKSGLLSRASGGRVRVAYAPPFAREGAWLFATRLARIAPRRISRFDRNLALVRFVAGDVAPAATPLRVDRAAASDAAAALGEDAPIAIHPGTSPGTPHKRWTAEGYARVASALLREEGVSSLVTFGPDPEERRFAATVVDASQGAARLAPETKSLAALAGLLARCRLYVGGDTGPLHIASLVGTPVVQILGPTDPIENAPWSGTPARSVRVPVACSPCRRGCAAATCMRVVPANAVIAAARELLAARASHPAAFRRAP